MKKQDKNIPDEISIPVWWRGGGMMYRRDCLPEDHPEHTYNYIKRVLGLEPEKYGICKSSRTHHTCPKCGFVFDDIPEEDIYEEYI